MMQSSPTNDENIYFRTNNVEILGVKINIMQIGNAIKCIENFIEEGGNHYICLCNVDVLVKCQKDKDFFNVVNNADLILPDGMPLVWGAKLSGFKHAKRIDGPSLMLAVCERSCKKKLSHFLYGGKKGQPELLSKKLSERYPGIKVSGCYSPPFRPLDSSEDKYIVEMINNSNADILWVGLGAPKQERWMSDHVGKINVPVMIGVGAAFDFNSGNKKRAPQWMQCIGLEWLFRLMQEPNRLWRRYILGNTYFILYFLLQILGLRYK